ncbi:MAG TPA: hypothetical protein VNM14_26670 [Planctomycetota bacterium]|nr:hypothetical protein [Planctomycetota bacterium]
MGLLLALLCQDSIPDLVRQLNDDSIELREKAARRLRVIGEEALPVLKAADTSDLDFKSRAELLAKKIDRERWFDPALLKAHPEFADALLEGPALQLALQIRSKAEWRENFETYAIHLLETKDREMERVALSLLPDRYPSARYVLRAIENWEPEACNDRDQHWLQVLVGLALDGVTPQDRPLLEKAVGTHWASKQAIAVLQTAVAIPQAEPTTVELLQKGTPWLRRPAILAAGKGGCKAARENLTALLNSPTLAKEAAASLREIDREADAAPAPPPPPPPPDPQPARKISDELQGAAKEKLVKMLPEWEAAEAAQKARRHPWCATGDTVERGLVAADILAALADTGDRLLAPLFVERLCSPDSQIRQTAIRVCGEWKIAEAAPILRRLACVGAPDVRRSAHVALENKESHR